MTTEEYFNTATQLNSYLRDKDGNSIVYNIDGFDRTFTTTLRGGAFILYGHPTPNEIEKGETVKDFTLGTFLSLTGITLYGDDKGEIP